MKTTVLLLRDSPDVTIAWGVSNIGHGSRVRNYKIASSQFINNRHQEVWLAD
ncbi:MAG: hypothetical protein HYX92_20785 [Chloroflexi bacterium]|nr:hypothetical protein [Chloroflexota bacterium]